MSIRAQFGDVIFDPDFQVKAVVMRNGERISYTSDTIELYAKVQTDNEFDVFICNTETRQIEATIFARAISIIYWKV